LSPFFSVSSPMKNYTKILLAAFAVLTASTLFTGCETVRSAVYDEQIVSSTGTLPVDAVELTPGQFVAVTDLEPGSFSPQQVIPAGTEVTTQTVELVPSAAVQTTLDVASSVGGSWGGLVGLLASGVLGIYAKTQRKHRTTAENVNAAVVQGIDVFRDILDQTPQGAVIDEKLKAVLHERQLALNVVSAVDSLLKRYKTPTKQPIQLAAK